MNDLKKKVGTRPMQELENQDKNTINTLQQLQVCDTLHMLICNALSYINSTAT